MFLLTEGTLFFLNLALSNRTRDQKPSLRTVVQTWADGVAAATDSIENVAPHTTTSRSISRFFSESTPQNELKAFTALDRHLKVSRRGFFPTGSDHEHDHISISVNDKNRHICFLDASPAQWTLDSRKSLKRKLVDCPVAKHCWLDTRPSKKFKHEGRLVPCFSSPVAATVTYISTGTPHPQPMQRYLLNKEGYAIEALKCYEFTHWDLPVPCDQRWSQSFLSTAILWYSVQRNVWSVPEEELTDALQRIFNVVYPGFRYTVNPASSVFKLTLRRINDWRNSFGSSALAIMLHFFSTFDNNDDVHAAAEFLSTDLRFLQEDPDSAEPTDSFRSPFLLLLIAITHIGDIDTFVDIPGWDTPTMAAGYSGEGVLALASVALERALRFICDGTLTVDQVLDEVPCYGDTHSKTMPNMFTPCDPPAALRFSSANWSGPTAVYQESARKLGAAFVSETFNAAQARRRRMTGDGDLKSGANLSVSGVSTSHALLSRTESRSRRTAQALDLLC